MESTECVRVAVNIRPLITPELLNGCTDCITVAPKEPQVLYPKGFSFPFFCVSFSPFLFSGELVVGDSIPM